MLTISIDQTKVQKKLNSVLDGLKDFTPIFEESGDDLLQYYGKTVFDSQGTESGVAWRSLSPATLYMRAHRYGYYKQPYLMMGQKLVWTGRLKKGFIKTIEATKLIISNPVDYFKYHQLGSSRTPKRKMLAVNKTVITMVMARFSEYLKKII